MTSPRAPSITTPTSSRRPSLDSPSHSPSPSRVSSNAPPHPPQRKNRLALRDYYNLPPPSSSSLPSPSLSVEPEPEADIPPSALDAASFSAPAHVAALLDSEGLDGVLRAEGRLVNEIRALDAARKALVYDNYSKLILATDTIRSMRTNMDPMAPTTATLLPAVGHIAQTAAVVAGDPRAAGVEKGGQGVDKDGRKGRREAEVVRWVVGAPERLRAMVADGREEEARREWGLILQVLGKWEEKGVEGLEEVRRRGEEAVGCVGGGGGKSGA